MPKCAALTNHMCVDTDARFRPCCVFEKTQTVIDHGNLSWAEYKQSEFYKEIQNTMTIGWHANCEKCRLEEELGGFSERMQMNSQLSGIPDQIEYLDICLSDECNLACKMCSPHASTKWKQIINKNPTLKIYPYYQTPTYANRAAKDIISQTDFTHVQHIKLIGGEPFLGKHFAQMLQQIKLQGNAAQTVLSTSTNCTIFPTQVLPDLAKFKMIVLNLSIDGCDDLCNYIRTGQPWSKVSSVVDKWVAWSNTLPNVHLTVNFTLQALNMHQYQLVKRWSQQLGVEFLCELLCMPIELSIGSVPNQYFNQLSAQGLVDDNLHNLYVGVPKYDPRLLLQLVVMQDQAMGTSIQQTIPELYNSLANFTCNTGNNVQTQ